MANVPKPRVSKNTSNEEVIPSKNEEEIEKEEILPDAPQEKEAKDELSSVLPESSPEINLNFDPDNPPTAPKPGQKNSAGGFVKIKLREDHRCFIGGERYSFKKGVIVSVPLNVKKILYDAGKLDPL